MCEETTTQHDDERTVAIIMVTEKTKQIQLNYLNC